MSELRELGAAVGTAIPTDMPLHGELMTDDRASLRGALRDVHDDFGENLGEGALDAAATAAAPVLDFVAEHVTTEALATGLATTALPMEVVHLAVAFHGFGEILASGDGNELLYGALGGPRDSVANRGTAAGIGAVLLGLRETDVEEIRAGLPRAALGAFDRGVARARELEGTGGFEEASERYRELQHDWADGRAAALGGWDDPGRGPAFERSRAATAAWMEGHPDEAREERAEYDAAFRDGFLAAEGSVDAYRERTDAAYRAGVRWHERSAATGDLELERTRIGGATAGILSLGGPVRA